ncbi:MAG: alcohol dehydrogenase catalytic domain-containing protein [Candidatus Helarchaeota archaeon]
MMKAAFYYDKGDFRVEEISLPKIKAEEALVKVKACGICGTDVHKAIYKTVKTPIVLGHEVSGEIVELGSQVKGFKVGDRVALAHHAGCGVCHYCRKGHQSLCDQYLKTNLDPGGFSTHIRVPAPNVRNTMLHIPRELSFNEAAFMEPLACCLRGFKKTRFETDDSVFIYGVGPIGLLFVQLARAFNASDIMCSDFMDYRLKYAKDFGASQVINPSEQEVVETISKLTNGMGIDLVIVTVGNTKVYEESTKIVGKGGDILFFAENLKGDFQLDPNLIYKKEACFVGSYSSSPFEYAVGLDMIKNQYLNVKKMITHKFKLENLDEAINLSHSPKDSLKIMINP